MGGGSHLAHSRDRAVHWVEDTPPKPIKKSVKDLTQLMQPIYNSHSAGGRQAGASCSVGYHKRAGADEAVSVRNGNEAWEVWGVYVVVRTSEWERRESFGLEGFGGVARRKKWSGVEGATAACEFDDVIFFI